MNQPAVRAFLTRITADHAARERLRALLASGDGRAQVVVDFAGQLGYAFTVRDLTGVAAFADGHPGELGDRELDAVAGGAAHDADQEGRALLDGPYPEDTAPMP